MNSLIFNRIFLMFIIFTNYHSNFQEHVKRLKPIYLCSYLMLTGPGNGWISSRFKIWYFCGSLKSTHTRIMTALNREYLLYNVGVYLFKNEDDWLNILKFLIIVSERKVMYFFLQKLMSLVFLNLARNWVYLFVEIKELMWSYKIYQSIIFII